MTPEQIALVETSLDELRPHLDGVAEDFYDWFFQADADAAALFTDDPQQRRKRFVDELELIVRLIRRHPAFLAAAEALGSRHRTYGVRAAHYRSAGPPLLAALATAAGEDWTPDLAEAWRLAYNLTTETMMAAADGRSQLHE